MNPKLSNFKALLFDVDRTLIPKDGTIFPELPDILAKFHQLGFHIGVCTGRGFPQIHQKVMPLFPKKSLHILGGGSQIIDSQGKVIWQKPISPEVIDQLKKFLSEHDADFLMIKPQAIFAPDNHMLERIKTHPWNYLADSIENMTNNDVGLVYVTNLNKEIIDFVKNLPELSYKNMVGNTGNRYIDITAKNINKGVTIKEYAQINSIKPSEIIGFGDSENDIEFLQTCGFAVAVGNADQKVKDVADKIIGDVDQKGLIDYLKNILKERHL
jgi:Cof subfamily protein (haloacid dehalogenase superfamily)